MKSDSSRRKFLATGLSLPVAGMASTRMPAALSLAAQGPSYRVLGKTGQKVTSVGFGCMITSDPSVISRALDMGVTYFDTARSYQKGNNERMVGAAIKAGRSKITLSSKANLKTGAEALQALDTSLQELGTDHLDIWYMHGKDKPDQITDDLVAAWESAKKQGKIRFIGLSTHDPNAVVDRILQVGKIEVVLSTYNFTMSTTRDAALQRLKDAGVGLVAMKVMAAAGGRRGEAPPPPPPEGRHLAALKWVLNKPLFATTIPSMTDTDQLETNFRAMAESFDPDDQKLLAVLNEEVRPYYCRMCYQCSGQCPQCVPVADTIRYLAYNDFYGQFALGREHFLALPEEIRKVRCSDCSTCAIKCPNGVQVRDRLIRAQEMFA
ncbi:MAG: hypothetical protein EHM65_08220 [Acidobacteriales bacterium]|nr:MAG: hypothetical protein EHM65_08220 [Terriglobales bacterium]